MVRSLNSLPEKGLDQETIFHLLEERRKGDKDKQLKEWAAHTFLYTFHVDDTIKSFAEEVYRRFLWTDGLSNSAFPSVRQCQHDLIDYAADLLGGNDKTRGTVTTGGTESIILAVKSARDAARKGCPDITEPEMVVPATAHPAFSKAAELLGLKAVSVRVGNSYSVNPITIVNAMTEHTVMIIGSAPAYWHGAFDPIVELGQLAQERDVWLHVDACFGGFLAPFARRLGYPIPDFDLSVPGVRSLSADFHKYAYTPKGASVLLFRAEEDSCYHTYTWEAEERYSDYSTPGLGGTKSGGPSAAAWAVMNLLGREGYLRLAGDVLRAVQQLRDGITAIDGLYLHLEPQLSTLSIGAEDLEVADVAAAMGQRGWNVNVFDYPSAIHIRLHPAHTACIDDFLHDLKESTLAAHRGEMVAARPLHSYAD